MDLSHGPKRPVLAYARPTTCNWCGGRLDRLRHVYKGRDSERYYDSENCLKRGEDRALRALTRAAGFQSSLIVGAVILALLMLSFAFVPKARAHDPNTHQADDLSNAKSDAFGVCCSGDDYTRVTDWETTATGYRVFVHGEWFEASRRVRVSNMQNPDGEAKVWINGPEGAKYVRCFMPGTLG